MFELIYLRRNSRSATLLLSSAAAIGLAAATAVAQVAPPQTPGPRPDAPPAAVASPPAVPPAPAPQPPVPEPPVRSVDGPREPVAPPLPPGTPPPREREAPLAPAVQMSGVVVGYNFGPRGNAEGLMIKSAEKLSQVNFPPDLGAVVSAATAAGEQINLCATPIPGTPDHGIFDLVSLTPARGEVLNVGRDAKPVHVDGVIQSLSYARHGEVNGVILESGDFVHLGPDGAATVKPERGQKIAADGPARPMPAGHRAIDAETVNGNRVRTAPLPPGKPERGPHRDHPGPEGRQAPPAAPGPDAAPTEAPRP